MVSVLAFNKKLQYTMGKVRHSVKKIPPRNSSPTVDELASPFGVHDLLHSHSNKQATGQQANNKTYTPKRSSNKSVTSRYDEGAILGNIIKPKVTKAKSGRKGKLYQSQVDDQSERAGQPTLAECRSKNKNNLHKESDVTPGPSKRLKVKRSPTSIEYGASPVHSSAHSVQHQISSLSKGTLDSRKSLPISKNASEETGSRKPVSSKKAAKQKVNDIGKIDTSDTGLISLSVSFYDDIFNYDTVANSSADEEKYEPASGTVRQSLFKNPTANKTGIRKERELSENSEYHHRSNSKGDTGKSIHKRSKSEGDSLGEPSHTLVKSLPRRASTGPSHAPIKHHSLGTSWYKCQYCAFVATTLSEINNHATGQCTADTSRDTLLSTKSVSSVTDTSIDYDKIFDTPSPASQRDQDKVSCGNSRKYTGKRKRKQHNCDAGTPGTSGVLRETDQEQHKESFLNDSTASATDKSVDYDPVFDFAEDVPIFKNNTEKKMYTRKTPVRELREQSEETNKLNSSQESFLNTSFDWLKGKDSRKQGKRNTGKKYSKRKSNSPKKKRFSDVQEEQEVSPDHGSPLDQPPCQDRTNSTQDQMTSPKDAIPSSAKCRGRKPKAVKPSNMEIVSPDHGSPVDQPPGQDRTNSTQDQMATPIDAIPSSVKRRGRKSKAVKPSNTEIISPKDAIPSCPKRRSRKPKAVKTSNTEISIKTDQISDLPVDLSSRKRSSSKTEVEGGFCSSEKKQKMQSTSDDSAVRSGTKVLAKGKQRQKRGRKKRRKPSRLDPDVIDEGNPSGRGGGSDVFEETINQKDCTQPSYNKEDSEETNSLPALKSKDDSSDEDLPDVFSTPSHSGLDFLFKGALVWAKYSRHPYWPSVVRNVYKKKNKIDKVSVIYLEYGKLLSKSGVAVTYKPGKILPFNLFGDHSKYAKFKDAGVKDGANFKESISQVESFLWHKAQGKEVEPFTYFQESFNYDLSEYEEENELNTDKCVSPANGRTETETPVNDLPDNSSSSSSPIDSQEMLQRNVEPQVIKRILKNQTLVDFIKTDRVKEHLLHIYHGKETSSLDTLYRKENKSRDDRLTLKFTCFGPIVDDMQQEEVSSTLMDFVKSTDLPYYEQAPYVFSVWIPEAVVYAIQKIWHQSKVKAWATYHKPPRLSKKERQQCTRDLMNSKSTIDPEDQYRYQLSRERRMQTLSGQTYSQSTALNPGFGCNLNMFQ